MAENKKQHTKGDGIVTAQSLEKAKEFFKKTGSQEAIFALIQQTEPVFFEHLIERINRDKDKFRQRGVSGKQLQMLSDVMLTYGIGGFLQHRVAMSLYDATKLDEIYGQNYEEWQDSILDEYIARKEKSKDQAPKPSIEPEKPKKNPGDLLDGSELG